MAERPDTPRGLRFWARQQRKARLRAGLTQVEMAEKIHFERSTVASVETMRRMPTEEYATACDRDLDMDGFLIDAYRELVAAERMPGWVAEFIDYERQALAIRTVEPTLIPGLLQTEAYARGVLGSGRLTSEAEISERVAVRLRRQEIFNRAQPPSMWAIVDESALRRRIGTTQTMFDQLAALLAAMHSGRADVQVIPYDAGPYPVVGPFTILDLGKEGNVVHLDGPAGGTTTADASIVSECQDRFDLLRSQALSLPQSADVIAALMEEYQS